MADELRIGLKGLLRKAQMEGDADFLREGVRALSQAIMEMEVEDHVGAARHERAQGRTGQRNGYRERVWDTRVGAVELKVPRVRDSSYFPSLLEPRRRAERALSAVVQEAYVHGVSTRKVDELVKALGMRGISMSRVSELCGELDEEVERFRSRPLEGPYPYVWVDATYPELFTKVVEEREPSPVYGLVALRLIKRGGSLMQDCATHQTTRFDTQTALALEAAFDGGRITSDGGLVWLSEMDEELGLCEAISERLPEWRNRRGRHPLVALVRQRDFQIASGYEDQNDSDALRRDPLLKMVCGSLPESGAELASQPTISRMENAATTRSCHRMASVLFELYLSQREKEGAPRRVLLDFDATADPTHGEQEGSYYHGYYGQHMYHPLLVFDGESGHLVTALLRAGNTHASRSSVAILKRIVSRLRDRWPGVAIEIRADAGFAIPALYDYCEREGITYTIALITNECLKQMAEDLLEEAIEEHQRTDEKVRLFGEDAYAAASWEKKHRVVYKAEAMEQGTNRRFVVSSRHDGPEALYGFYARRGESENWIKDFKLHMRADRLSCHRFVANQFRLLLHAAAYYLMDALRRKLIESGARRVQLDTLRLSLIKIGGRVRELATKIRLHLASGHPGQPSWQALSLAIEAVHE